MNISLAPETLFNIGSIKFTNTLFSALIIFIFIVLVFSFVKLTWSYKKPTKFQIVIEMLLIGLSDLSNNILGEKRGKSLFSFLFTFFILIFISNWFGLIPFVPTTVIGTTQTQINNSNQAFVSIVKAQENPNNIVSINNEPVQQNINVGDCLSTKACYITLSGIQKFSDEKHLFRAPTSDLSFTLAMAIISVVVTNILGFYFLRLDYLKKYINFTSKVNAFVSILETISEFGKFISFSFRLFGNVFAGEILLTVITSITYGVVTLPFLGLELFVGFIQALVFFMLTAALISLATTKHQHSDQTTHNKVLDELNELPLSP